MYDFEAQAQALAEELTASVDMQAAVKQHLLNHAYTAMHAGRYALETQFNAIFSQVGVMNYHYSRLPNGRSYTMPSLDPVTLPFDFPLNDPPQSGS